jgi:hypothetical protein
MLRYLPETANTGGTTASRIKYPNPYFDLSRTWMPKDIKTMFKFCRIFYYKNEFINNVIKKLAEYPITDILYDDIETEEIKSKYEILLRHEFKIKNLLIDIGLDYNTYGNCFVVTSVDFKRWLVCPNCKEKFQVTDATYKQIELKNFKYSGKCPKCNINSAAYVVEDSQLTGVKHLKFIRLNPELIDIENINVTGMRRYFYTLEGTIRQAILTGNRRLVDKVPWIFVEAVAKKQRIELDQNNLYHFRTGSPAEDDMGWGKPKLLPALGLIWYNQSLRRANEAIAAEHILPKRIISPAQANGVDILNLDMTMFKNRIEEQLLRWRQDENHVAVMPIPVNYQSMGGDGKILMLKQEIELNENSIIQALGVPVEFIKGGASWTGSSVSLRIVENSFLNYQELLLDFLNYFVVEKINQFLDYPRCRLKFKKLRMSDDSESKDLALRLGQAGWLASSNVIEEFGYDSAADKVKREADTRFDNEMANLRGMEQAKVQAAAQEILAASQGRAQVLAQEAIYSEDESLFSKELAEELKTFPETISQLLRKMALQIAFLPPEMQQAQLVQLMQMAPTSYGFVVRRMQGLLALSPQPEPPDESKGPKEVTKTVEKQRHTEATGASQEKIIEQTTTRPAEKKEEKK